MINLDYYNFFEKKIISNKNRFKLTLLQKKKILKKFNNSVILISGAAGSIGSVFTKSIKDINFKKLYLIDKDENELTELNRELVLILKNRIKKVEFICNDLNLMNLDNFFKKEKINHYINFAAIKHVRSEENLISLKYMIATNSLSFLPKNIKKLRKLKSIFSISTDKAVNPSSILGISKKIMELKLGETMRKNKKIFVSSARFANVSFSNGSILKLIVDKIAFKKSFGIPINISRFFITHDESISICLKSLLPENNGFIITPDPLILGRQLSIEKLLYKILKALKIKYKKNKKYLKLSNSSKVFLINKNISGQKPKEEFFNKNESIKKISNDKTILKISLSTKKIGSLLKIRKLKSINSVKKYFKEKLNFRYQRKIIKISQSI